VFDEFFANVRPVVQICGVEISVVGPNQVVRLDPDSVEKVEVLQRAPIMPLENVRKVDSAGEPILERDVEFIGSDDGERRNAMKWSVCHGFALTSTDRS